MKKLNKRASRILDELTRGLDSPFDDGAVSSRKLENNPAYMAVHVERIASRQYAVAHYRLQNGDLITDPEMVFVWAEDQEWYPTSFEMGGVRYEQSVELVAGHLGEISAYFPRRQAEHVDFANRWLANIDRQQNVLQGAKESS